MLIQHLLQLVLCGDMLPYALLDVLQSLEIETCLMQVEIGHELHLAQSHLIPLVVALVYCLVLVADQLATSIKALELNVAGSVQFAQQILPKVVVNQVVV